MPVVVQEVSIPPGEAEILRTYSEAFHQHPEDKTLQEACTDVVIKLALHHLHDDDQVRCVSFLENGIRFDFALGGDPILIKF